MRCPKYRNFLIYTLQSINQFISRHSTEARATVRLCRIKEKCVKTNLKCVNGWSSLTVQWKRVPKFRSSNRETTSSSVQVRAAALLHEVLYRKLLYSSREIAHFVRLVLKWMKWNEMKWNEMKWNEMKWNEMNEWINKWMNEWINK